MCSKILNYMAPKLNYNLYTIHDCMYLNNKTDIIEEFTLIQNMLTQFRVNLKACV